jgi:hypothetical protein
LIPFFAEHKQAWRLIRKILMKLQNILSMNMTWKNNPRKKKKINELLE